MVTIRDAGVKSAMRSLEEKLNQGQVLSTQDVQKLQTAALDGGKVTDTERADLKRILDAFSSRMEPAAADSLRTFVNNQGTPPVSDALSPLQLRITGRTMKD